MPHSSSASDRLSPLDALFVYLEKKEMPLHIASISTFDGPIPLQKLKAFIEAKLPLIPRYRQRMVFPPFNLGHPTWENDPEFDIDRHIHSVRLKNGTQDDLQAVSGRILSEVMDRNKPLWDLTLVEGLEGGRSGLISRVHHCLVDGVAGVALMSVMLDKTPKMPRLPKREPFHAPPLPNAASSLLDALVSSYSEIADQLLATQSAALNMAQSVISDGDFACLDQVARIAPELVMPVERLPFNKPVLGPRQVSWAAFPMGEASAIRMACGTKINDLVLTMVSGAVRLYSELHGQSMKRRFMRVMVPVNLWPDLANPGTGNYISFVPLSIPLDIPDAAELMDVIRQRMDAMKRTHIADLIAVLGRLAGTVPAPVQAAFGWLGNRLPVPIWNMVVTNVPGPQYPLYLLGREMLTYYPYVPIGTDMGVCCAIESYNGNLFFTFSGDSYSAPDLNVLRDYLYDVFAELKKKAGLIPERPVRQRPAKRAARVEPVAARPHRRKPAAARATAETPVATPEAVFAAPVAAEPASEAPVAARPRRRKAAAAAAMAESPVPTIEAVSSELVAAEAVEPVAAEKPVAARPRRRKAAAAAAAMAESPVSMPEPVFTEPAAAEPASEPVAAEQPVAGRPRRRKAAAAAAAMAESPAAMPEPVFTEPVAAEPAEPIAHVEPVDAGAPPAGAPAAVVAENRPDASKPATAEEEGQMEEPEMAGSTLP